jgi:tetratricopeptide (TPR) repeat protein
MVLTRLGQPTAAITDFRKVVELDSRSPDAHLNLGIALADQFDLEGALREFTQAVQLAPDAPAPHYNKGRALVDLQRNPEAKPELETAARLDPNLPDAWYLLGIIAKQAGETEKSIDLFGKVVTTDPNNADALFMLGQALLRSGDRPRAIQYWRKVIEMNPDHGEALYNLSRLLTQMGAAEAKVLQDRFEALQTRRHIMDRAQTLGNFALSSAAAHDWPQAIAQLQEGLSICGDCSALALLHKNLGLIYCRSGDLKSGRVELLEALKLTPKDPDITAALQLLEKLSK